MTSLHGRKHICIGIPTLGVVSTRWAISYGAICAPMNTIVARIVKQDLPVDQARNDIVAKVLGMDGPITHLLFLDDDVLMHPHGLLQLLSAEKDIVAGVYYTKSDEFPEPLALLEPGRGRLEYVPGSGLHQVWGVGMGLTLVRTEVYRRMAETLDLGADRLGHPRWYYTSGDVPGEGLRCTEDLWFCAHAREAGYDCWVDMHPYAFGWHYCYRRQKGYPRPQWEQYLKTGEVSFEVSDEAMAAAGLTNGQTFHAAIHDETLAMVEAS